MLKFREYPPLVSADVVLADSSLSMIKTSAENYLLHEAGNQRVRAYGNAIGVQLAAAAGTSFDHTIELGSDVMEELSFHLPEDAFQALQTHFRGAVTTEIGAQRREPAV